LEVWFVELAGTIYVLHDPWMHGDWVKNIQADPAVSFSIVNRKNAHSELAATRGHGRIVDEISESELCRRVRASMHIKYRWTTGVIVEIAPVQ
jgi:hypothetical protein